MLGSLISELCCDARQEYSRATTTATRETAPQRLICKYCVQLERREEGGTQGESKEGRDVEGKGERERERRGMRQEVISQYPKVPLYENLSQRVTGKPTKPYANFSVFTKILCRLNKVICKYSV